MKRPTILSRLLAVTLVALLLAGCWKDRLCWSPDGSRAAILTKDGLHLCTADGKITTLLAPGAYRVAWLSDSQRLVVARSRPIRDYAALVATLGVERTQLLATEAEIVWRQWLANPTDDFKPAVSVDDDLGAILLYVREHHEAELRTRMAQDPKSNPKEIETFSADWHSLVVTRVVNDRLEFGPTLSEGLAAFINVRVAPNDAAAAFVTRRELVASSDNSLRIFLAPLDGSATAELVASQTAAHPDWTPDGRTLVYLKAASDHATNKDLQLGALVERDVLDPQGRIQLAKDTRDLAGLIFQEQSRVRCLRDGRVLFDAAEFHLPLAGGERPIREQLFALDRNKAGAPLAALIPRDQLERAPKVLAEFEVSPDQKQVLFNGESTVHVFTLATRRVESIALNVYDDSEKNPPLPVWRRPGEITYVRKTGARIECVLRQGDAETILSRTWPEEVLARLVE